MAGSSRKRRAEQIAGLDFCREIRWLRLRVDGVEKDEIGLCAVARERELRDGARHLDGADNVAVALDFKARLRERVPRPVAIELDADGDDPLADEVGSRGERDRRAIRPERVAKRAGAAKHGAASAVPGESKACVDESELLRETSGGIRWAGRRVGLQENGLHLLARSVGDEETLFVFRRRAEFDEHRERAASRAFIPEVVEAGIGFADGCEPETDLARARDDEGPDAGNRFQWIGRLKGGEILVVLEDDFKVHGDAGVAVELAGGRIDGKKLRGTAAAFGGFRKQNLDRDFQLANIGIGKTRFALFGSGLWQIREEERFGIGDAGEERVRIAEEGAEDAEARERLIGLLRGMALDQDAFGRREPAEWDGDFGCWRGVHALGIHTGPAAREVHEANAELVGSRRSGGRGFRLR